MEIIKNLSGNSKSNIYDCPVLELPKIHNRAGNITALEYPTSLPFAIERVYYLYDIPGGEERGGHAHKELHQLIIAASGSFDVILYDGIIKKSVHLNRPYFGLLVVPGIWRELVNFSSGAISLVLASHHYNEADYIREIPEYKIFKSL